MGCILKLIDAILFLFFLIIAIVAPLIDAQSCLPIEFYPKFLVDLSSWYSNEYGDYLVIEKPNFFIGLVWMEIVFIWPLALINLFGLICGRSWFNTSCLMFGVAVSTSMVAILGEMIGSGRASDKLKMMYFPFMGLAILAVVRGLISPSSKTPSIVKRPLLGPRKKRA